MMAVCFDCETTGLIANPARKLEVQPEIISIAIQRFDLDRILFDPIYYHLFKPTKKISSEITKINGISNDDVKNMPSIEDYLDEIIYRLNDGSILIGQNLIFDKSMLELECKRYNKQIKWLKGLDLVENSIFIRGYRLGLTNLHIELFGKEFEGAHKADTDVVITTKCAIEMRKRGML